MSYNLQCCLFQFLPVVAFNMGDVNEICDYEGSTAIDCPVRTHCCKQLECDIIYNPDQNTDKRCCNESEWQQEIAPNDCMMCTECCDESERNQIPRSKYTDRCSKCPKCKEG